MAKKVLIISSSPRRKGNSDILCNRFALGAQESGNEVEKIFLKDKKIAYCTGCGFCFKTHVCAQKDDMNEILEKMLQVDVIVLATPVYFYSMCAQMKTFIDRTTPKYTQMKDKEFYYILTAADTEANNLHRTMEAFRGFSEDCLENAKECGVIYGINSWNMGDVINTPAYEEAYIMGKKI